MIRNRTNRLGCRCGSSVTVAQLFVTELEGFESPCHPSQDSFKGEDEMGIKKVRGGKEYQKFAQGKKITRKEAMLAMCYDCLGGEGMREDCMGTMCPLYPYYPNSCKMMQNRTL